MDLIETLSKCLHEHDSKRTEASLGDRSAYVGMSDIGRAADCLRVSVANKTAGQLAVSFDRQVRLHRGHWFEAGIAEAFRYAGQPFLYQLTVQTVHHGVPVKAHPDFVFVDADGTIEVVELKSCERLPDTAYATHEMQLFGQLGLLSSCRNSPCFSLPDTEPTTLPALVKQELGIVLPKRPAICGQILCVSMSGAKAFGPYEPNDIMLAACLDLAEQVWTGMNGVRNGEIHLADLPTATGFNPLCDWCDWNADCPKFTGSAIPELEDDLLEIRRLKAEKENLETRLQAMDRQLRMACKASKGDWLTTDTMRVRLISCEGKRVFDKERLQNELEKRLDADTVINIMESACRDGKPYDRLMFGSINRKEDHHGPQAGHPEGHVTQ
jgi:hypothetical protein